MLQLKEMSTIPKTEDCCHVNISNEKQYLGSQDLVNDLDEWEEGWVG